MATSLFAKPTVFSSMALDQAHEQHNAAVMGDGGAIGLTQSPRSQTLNGRWS